MIDLTKPRRINLRKRECRKFKPASLYSSGRNIAPCLCGKAFAQHPAPEPPRNPLRGWMLVTA